MAAVAALVDAAVALGHVHPDGGDDGDRDQERRHRLEDIAHLDLGDHRSTPTPAGSVWPFMVMASSAQRRSRISVWSAGSRSQWLMLRMYQPSARRSIGHPVPGDTRLSHRRFLFAASVGGRWRLGLGAGLGAALVHVLPGPLRRRLLAARDGGGRFGFGDVQLLPGQHLVRHRDQLLAALPSHQLLQRPVSQVVVLGPVALVQALLAA